jgi:hypothetical protein
MSKMSTVNVGASASFLPTVDSLGCLGKARDADRLVPERYATHKYNCLKINNQIIRDRE